MSLLPFTQLPPATSGDVSSSWRLPALQDSRRMSRKQLNVFMSVTYFAVGFSPITALALAIIGWLALDVGALLLVAPTAVLGLALAFLFPAYGKLALKGLAIGLIAVFLYDCMRVPFLRAGVWGDFIPKISLWLLHTSHPNWLVGYLWRYLGDGGCMGMAFTVAYCTLQPRVGSRTAAVGFGVAIWLSLVATLLLAPHGQEMLFQLTPVTVSLSLLGHLIYGAALGWLLPAVCRQEVTRGERERKNTASLLHMIREESSEEETVKLPRIGRGEQTSTRKPHQPIVVACMAVVEWPSFTVRMLKKRSAPLDSGGLHTRIVQRRCGWECSTRQAIPRSALHQVIRCVKGERPGCGSICMRSLPWRW